MRKEDYGLMSRAALLMFFALLVYSFASFLSYIPTIYLYVCPINRCPDHLWMQNSYWRNYYFLKGGPNNKPSTERGFGIKSVQQTTQKLQHNTTNRIDYQSRGFQDQKLGRRNRDVIMLTAGPIGNTLPFDDEETDNAEYNPRRITHAYHDRSHIMKVPRQQSEEEVVLAEETKNGLKEGSEDSEASWWHLSGHLGDANDMNAQPRSHPYLALLFSVLFNVIYTAFLIYVILVYVAFRTEMKGVVPIVWKEKWFASRS